jgi:hypothetical protein
LTIDARAADPRLAPEMMILVDADVAFRCSFELDTGRCRRYLVDVERAGLLDGELPQPRPEISRLRHVADYDLVTPHLLEGGHKRLVVRVIERLEVLHAGIAAHDVLAADSKNLVFGDGDRH